MLREAFGEHSGSLTATFEWHSRFEVSQVSVEDNKYPGQPSTCKMTENFEKIWELTNEDHRHTIHELTDTVRISYEVCHEILTEDLNTHCIAHSSWQCAHPHIPENHRVCD
jgi:hypothetical protein